MNTASITVRVDEQTKKEAAAIAEDFGLDLSSVTRAFYRQMVRENRIPINLNYPQPNDETLSAFKETEEMIANGAKGYSSLDQMYAAMDKNDA